MNGISAQNEPFHRLISIILRHDSVHIILQLILEKEEKSKLV